MGETLLTILDELTVLTTDTDLFYLEIPLGKIGVWVAESQIDSRFNSSGRQEFDIYARFKTKASGLNNITYLKNTIDGFSGSTGTCELEDGRTFKLEVLSTWDFMEKDSEGYFVWANRLSLVV